MSRGLLLGIARGLGSQMQQRQQREDEEQKRVREEQGAANKNYGSFLENLLNSDAIPDHTKDTAMQGLFRIMTTPGGLDKKSLEKMGVEITNSIAMPRNVLGGQQAAQQAKPQIGKFADAMSAVPLPGFREMAEGARGITPEPATTTGLIGREERDNYANVQRRATLEAKPVTPQYDYQKGPDGVYVYENGQFTGKTPFPEGASDEFTPNTPVERYYSLALKAWRAKNPGQQPPPEVEQEMLIEAQRRVGMADDRPRQFSPSAGWGPMVVEQNPDGTVNYRWPLAEKTGRSPAGESVVAGGNPKMSDTAKDKKMMVEGMLRTARRLQTNAAANPGAIGMLDNLTGLAGEYEFMGMSNSDEENWLRADVTDLASQLGLLRSGQAVSEQEAQRLSKILPQIGKGEKNFAAKVDRFIKELEFILERRYGANGVGDADAYDGDVGFLTGSGPTDASGQLLLQQIMPTAAGTGTAGSIVPARPGAVSAPPPAAPAANTAGPKVGDIRMWKGQKIRIKTITGGQVTDYDIVK